MTSPDVPETPKTPGAAPGTPPVTSGGPATIAVLSALGALVALVVAVVLVNTHPGLDIDGLHVRCDSAVGAPVAATTPSSSDMSETDLTVYGSSSVAQTQQAARDDCAHQRASRLGHAVEALAASVLLLGVCVGTVAWIGRSRRRVTGV